MEAGALGILTDYFLGRSAGKLVQITSLSGNHQQDSLVITFFCHTGILVPQQYKSEAVNGLIFSINSSGLTRIAVRNPHGLFLLNHYLQGNDRACIEICFDVLC